MWLPCYREQAPHVLKTADLHLPGVNVVQELVQNPRLNLPSLYVKASE